jgi:hypothetical protein
MSKVSNQRAYSLKSRFLRIRSSIQMQSMDLSSLDNNTIDAIESALNDLEMKINRAKSKQYRPF